MLLRPLTKKDITYFLIWWRNAEHIALTSGNITPITDVQAHQYFVEMFQQATHIHRMIEVDGTTIGHISLIPHSLTEYELQTIIGESEYQNKGYGTQAIAKMLLLAKKHGAKTVVLYVRPENARAIRVYEKSGFVQVGKIIATGNKDQPKLVKMELSY